MRKTTANERPQIPCICKLLLKHVSQPGGRAEHLCKESLEKNSRMTTSHALAIYVIIIYLSPSEFEGKRCDPNSVGYKKYYNYSQAWGYRTRLLSSIFSKMALAKKCQFIFNKLGKRTSLNTVICCPYEMPGVEKPFIEAHTFLTKCLCCFSKPAFAPCSFATKCPFDFNKPVWSLSCFLTKCHCDFHDGLIWWKLPL